MPTLQVLSREPNKGAEMLGSIGKDVMDVIQAKQNLELYKIQVEAQKRATENAADKLEYERDGQWADTYGKYLTATNDPEQALKLTNMALPETHHSMKRMDRMGNSSVVKDRMKVVEGMGKTPTGLIKTAQANVLNQFSNGGAPAGQTVPIGDLSENAGTNTSVPIGGSRAGMMVPDVNIMGIHAVNPDVAASIDATKKTAVNKADLLSRNLGPEEQKTAGFADAVIRNVDEAVANIGSLKGGMVKGSLRRSAVDAQNPALAGEDVEPLQGSLNRLRNIIIYLRSGAQINDQEASRLSQLLQTFGKTDSQIKKDLLEFKQDAVRRIGLIKEGAPSLENTEGQNPAITGSGYLRTGTLPDGRRVGVKADGTTEIINGR